MTDDVVSLADQLRDARPIMGDDVLEGMTRMGCLAVWPSGYLPEVEAMLERYGALEHIEGAVGCRVVGEVVRLGRAGGLVCYPMAGSNPWFVDSLDLLPGRRDRIRPFRPRDLRPSCVPLDCMGFAHPVMFFRLWNLRFPAQDAPPRTSPGGTDHRTTPPPPRPKPDRTCAPPRPALHNRVMASLPTLLRGLPLGRVEGVSPVFVVGMPRSGTTLLRLMLNAHPGLAIAGESFAFHRSHHYGPLHHPEQLRRFVADLTPLFTRHSPHPDLLDDPDLRAALSRAPSYAEALHLVMSAYAHREGKPRWGEKTPSHVRQVGTIVRAFAQAQVVHIVRDPRAVVVSRRQAFDGGTFTDAAVYHLARGWRRSIALLDRYDDGGGRYRMVRYEDLVARTEETLRDLCGFLGIPFSATMLDYHRDAGRYVPSDGDGTVAALYATTVQTPSEDRVERWRDVLTPEHAALVEAAADPVMTRLGYLPGEGGGDRPGPVRRLRAIAGADIAVLRGRLRGVGLRLAPAVRRIRRPLRRASERDGT